MNEAIQLKNDYVDAYINRGVTYGKKGEYERAIQDLDKAIDHSNQTLQMLIIIAGLVYDIKDEIMTVLSKTIAQGDRTETRLCQRL